MSAVLLKGSPVAAALTERARELSARLAERGKTPTLAILRVGERPDDLSYERGAKKRCAEAGVEVRSVALDAGAGEEEFFSALEALNRDPGVHGILVMRPLPNGIDGERARNAIRPEKDVDGCTDGSLAGVFTGAGPGFPPCTARAVTEILDHYGVAVRGKSAVVIGRSLVVGRPAALLLMHKDATVTVCHSRSADVAETARRADVIVACAGRPESVDGEYLRDGQTVIDVGMSWSEEKGKLCGDVKMEDAQDLDCAVTPVPGGVGAVTSAVLAYHTALAAARLEGLPTGAEN